MKEKAGGFAGLPVAVLIEGVPVLSMLSIGLASFLEEKETLGLLERSGRPRGRAGST